VRERSLSFSARLLARLTWLAPFERGESQLELVDPVPQDLQLGFVSEPSLRCPAQPGRCLRACGYERERHQSLRPVWPVDQSGRDLTGPVPVAQRSAGCAGIRRGTLKRDPLRARELGGELKLKLPCVKPVVPVHDAGF